MITSTSNARIKRLVNLKKKRKIKRRRKRLPGRRNPYVQGSAARQVKKKSMYPNPFTKKKKIP